MYKREEFFDLKEPKLFSEFAKGIVRKYNSGVTLSGLKEGEEYMEWDEHGEWDEQGTKLYGHPWAWCQAHCSIVKDGHVVADKVLGYS